MRNRSLGMIVVAGVVAIAAIGVTLAMQSGMKQEAPLAIDRAPAAPTLPADWQALLNQVVAAVSTSTETYTPPPGLSSTEALARQLFTNYAAAKGDGELDMDEAEAAIAGTLTERVKETPSARTHTIAELSVHADVPATAYKAALAKTLGEMNDIKEYELATYARAIHDGNRDDFARLKADAAVYAVVAEKLMELEVPSAAATQHLAAVNALLSLSSAVKGLAAWNGDPLDALVAVNAFAAAENAFSKDISALVSLTKELEKKT